MTTFPTGLRFDVEFTAGVWTDVTSLVLADPEPRWEFGRSSEFSSPQPATCKFTLNNTTGNFTARNAGSAYFPNVVPGKRVRVSYGSGASPMYVGFVKSWTPSLREGVLPVVEVFATDRLDVVSRATLPGAHWQAMSALAPVTWLPMDDGDTFAVGTSNGSLLGTLGDAVTGAQLPVFNYFSSSDAVLTPGGSAVRPVDGGTALGAEAGASGSLGGVTFALPTPISTTAYSLVSWVYLDAPISATGQIEIKLLANGTAGNIADMAYATSTPSGGTTINSTTALGATAVTGIVSPPTTTAAAVRTPHLFVLTGSSSTSTASLYLDGSLVGTTTGSGQTTMSFVGAVLYVNQVGGGTGTVTGRISDFAVFNRQLSAGEILDLYNAGASGYAGELSGARVARILGYAGLSASDYNVATGSQAMGVLHCEGSTVGQLLEQVATTEGGGAAIFTDVDGRVRFVDRTFRNTATPVLTIDASVDLRPGDWNPTSDNYAALNKSTVERVDGGTATYSDGTAVPDYEVIASGAFNDENNINLASWRVISSQTRPRFPRLVIDIAASASAASLYTALTSITIGSLVRINNFPKTLTRPGGGTTRIFYTSQFDTNSEGWVHEVGKNSYRVSFDLSPHLPRLLVGDTTWGRLLGTTQTLTSTITSGATSMSLTTSAGPVLTTSAGDYPLYLQIDEEIVSVSSAPGGASPQTLTITRAQLGTFADAHTAGATVTVLAGALTV